MDHEKVLVLFFINLISLNFIFAQEFDDGEPPTTNAAENGTYSSFPFELIFGQANKNDAKNNEPLQQEDPLYDSDVEDSDINKARGVYWIPSTCDSLLERGYTCYSCSESLHCMGGNFALRAICGGRRPFCYNGVCSDLRSEKCRRENEIIVSSPVGDITHEEVTLNSTMT